MRRTSLLARAIHIAATVFATQGVGTVSFASDATVNGIKYQISPLITSYQSSGALLQSQPWWNDLGSAQQFLGQASTFCLYGYCSMSYQYAYSASGTSVSFVDRLGNWTESDVLSTSYAIAVPLPSNTVSTVASNSTISLTTTSGVSKNAGATAGGKLTAIANTANPNSSTFGDLIAVTNSLWRLGSASAIDAAWEQLTAEPYASNLSVGLESMNRFRKNALAIALADNKNSYTKTEKVKVCQEETGQASTSISSDQDASKLETNCAITKVKKKLPWSLVIDGTNTQASLRGTEDLGSLDYNIFQSTYGVEYALSDQFSIGGVFGYGQNNLYNYEFADTRVNSDTYSGGLYGLYKPSEPATIALLGGYSRFNSDSRRPIQFGTINRLAEADWNSNGYTVALTGEYAFTLSKVTESADPKQKEKERRNAILLKPNALVSFAGYSQGLIEESGAQSLNLKLNPHTATSVIFGGGLVLQAPIVVSAESRLIPRLGVGYRYDLNGNSDEEHEVTGGFVDLPEAGEIDVYGQNRGSNDVDVSLGLEYEISSSTAIYSNVAGSFWSNGNELTYGGGFRYSW